MWRPRVGKNAEAMGGKVHPDETTSIIPSELHSVSSFAYIIMLCGLVKMDTVDVQKAICRGGRRSRKGPKSSFANDDVFSFSESSSSKGSGETRRRRQWLAEAGPLRKRKHGQIEQSDTGLRKAEATELVSPPGSQELDAHLPASPLERSGENSAKETVAGGGWSAEKEEAWSDRTIGYVPSDSEGNVPGTPPRFSTTRCSSACESFGMAMRTSSARVGTATCTAETGTDRTLSAGRDSEACLVFMKAKISCKIMARNVNCWEVHVQKTLLQYLSGRDHRA
ncbi:hypothetical protein EAI_04517 [Harpegnathos saltator]|uniref:Uncharacterized protein n=1 Tax=Harpegnathos saltator TaxID=610380 RepID=E2BKX5_HARSA|nr:hypothetical protein EAI_04517 [Harpegnathos saltator]